MFVCDLCGISVPPKTKANRVPIEKRPRHYPARKTTSKVSPKGKTRSRHRDDPGGQGWEIVKEVITCPDCADRGGTEAEAES